MVNHSAAPLTATSLLDKFLELRQLSPDVETWSESYFQDSPPRLARWRQWVALLRAFEIDCRPTEFVEGQFLRTTSERYVPLLQRLKLERPDILESSAGDYVQQLPFCFNILLEYRIRLEEVLSNASGVLEASGLYLLMFLRAEQLNRTIRENVEPIDALLGEFISPERAQFTLEQLARDFNYPLVDLLELDFLWF